MRALVIPAALLAFSLSAQQPWTLDQCLLRAEQQNLTYRNAQLQADLADKASDQSRWALLPDLNAGATHGYNWGKAVDRYTNTFATDRVRTNNLWLSSNWTLFQGFRLQNERKKADIDADASMKGLEAQRNTIRKEVVNNFLNVLGLREKIHAAESQAASTREQLDVTKALVDAGRLARAQQYDLNAQLAQEDMNVVDLQNQLEQALLQFGQLLFLSPDEQRAFDIAAPSVASIAITEPQQSVDDVLAVVLAADPAYAESELRVQSADRNESIARSGSLPSLIFSASVGSGYSGSNTEFVGDPIVGDPVPIGYTESGEEVLTDNVTYDVQTRDFGDQLEDNVNYSTSWTLSVPLFNNMRNRLAIDQARVQLAQAELDRDGEKQRVQRDVQDALLQQRAAYRQFEAASSALEAANESLRYAEERFGAGAITSAEFNIAKNNVARSTADVINARYAWLMAAKALDILQGLPVTL
jgi:outer membrane protein